MTREPLKLLITFFFVLHFTLYTLHEVYARGPGTTGMNFLKIGVGARPAAMGGAFSGLANDVNAVYWNPAGLARIGQGELSFAHTEWIEGMRFETLGVGQRINGFGVMGLTINYFSMGETQGYDEDDKKTDMFTAYDRFLSLTWAAPLTASEKILIGGTVKLIQEKIEEEKAEAYAGDAGMLYEPGQRFSIGISVLNFGSKVQFISESDPLPLTIKAGGAYRLSKGLTIAVDASKPIDNEISVHTGIEWVYKNLLAVRTGFKTDTIENLDALSGLSGGLGFHWKGWGIDYAWVPYGKFGSTHRINLMGRFGISREERETRIRKQTRARKNYGKVFLWYREKAEKMNLHDSEKLLLLKRIIKKYKSMGINVKEAEEEKRRIQEMMKR